MQQSPTNADAGAYWFMTLCCGGGGLAILFVAILGGFGKLFNKATDEKIERDAEVYRRGLRE